MTVRPDVHDRGDKWVSRGSWSVRQRELSFRVRISWVQWAHDVGIWPKFVDARQLGGDYLTRAGFRVLILPRVVAMSDATAAAIRRFAEQGGTVIADTWCGLMDDRCKLRPAGVLDGLFGVRRGDWRKLDLAQLAPGAGGIKLGPQPLPFMPFEKTLRAAPGVGGASYGAPKAATRFRGADVAVTRQTAKGRAVYLNFRMESYFLHRLMPRMTTAARSFLLNTLAEAGVRPAFSVRKPGRDLPFHPAGHDVCVYASGRGYLVGVRPNPTVMRSEVGGVESRYREIADNVFAKAHPAELAVPPGLWTYDLTEGKAAGRVRAVRFGSVPDTGRFFACWPFEIRDLTAAAEVTPRRRLKIAGRIVTSAPVIGEKLAVALRVLGPDGTEQRGYRRTLDCDGGAFAAEIPLGLDERGKGSAVIRDPCTGKTVKLSYTVP